VSLKNKFSQCTIVGCYNGRIDSSLTRLGFTKSKEYYNLYFKVMKEEPMILLLYVDDLFLTGEEMLITECKKKLTS
jgi:hypothetical protein